MENNDLFNTSISFEDLVNIGDMWFRHLAKQVEEEKNKEEEKIKSYPIQLKHVGFSEKDIRKYNIDTRYRYFMIVGKDNGKPLIDRMFIAQWNFNTEEKILENLNSDCRYVMIEAIEIGKYTKEDKKKYKYLKGDFRLESHWAIVDKENWKIVYMNEEMFGNQPYLYNNVMYSKKTGYVYLPTMKPLMDGSYVSNTLHTKNKIIIKKNYNDDHATIIDTNTGEISIME